MIAYSCDKYSIKIDENKGNINSFTIGNKEIILPENRLPIFEVKLREKGGRAIFADAYSAGKKSCTYENNRCVVHFSDFETVDIEVFVYAEFASDISWRVKVKNNTQLAVEWVNFPQIAVPDDLVGAGGNARILWGFNEGVVIDDIKLREEYFGPRYIEPDYPSEGFMGIFPAIVETQFMAYYDMTNGLYIGTHDKCGNLKGIDFFSYKNGIKLQFKLFAGAERGADFDMDYDLVFDTFAGDWHNAAEIYRGWFLNNCSKEFVKIPENPKIPQWYSTSPVIVTYPVRGLHDMDTMTPNKLFPYINAMKHIERLADELDSRIMVILMHWEGSAPWAPPYVWPPYGGEAVFKEFVDALHDKGQLIGVYCSGLGWTQQSNVVKEYNMSGFFEREGLKDVMCLSPEEDLPPSKICSAQRSGYDMCPAVDFTVKTIAAEVEKMVSGGVDYIQVLDQNHGGTPYFCYSDKHSHPPVPGKWQTEAMKNLLSELEKYTYANGKKVLLGCESAAAETYIPNLLFSDNRYEINYGIGTPAPVYAYVYHEYLNNFMGNQVCAQYIFDHDAAPENMMHRIAHAFCAGDLLTVVIDQDGEICWNWGNIENRTSPDRKAVTGFMRNLNAWRRGYAAFLHTGKMAAPRKLNNIGKNSIPLSCGYCHSFDSLMTSAWEADGERVQFVVNYNNRDEEFSLPCDAYVRMEIDSEEKFYPTGEKISIKALSACVFKEGNNEKA